MIGKKIFAVTALAMLSVVALSGCTSDTGPQDTTEVVKDETLYPNSSEVEFTVKSGLKTEKTPESLPYTEVIDSDKLFLVYGGSSSCAPEIDKVSFDEPNDTVIISIYSMGKEAGRACTMDYVPHSFSIQSKTDGFSFEGKEVEFVSVLNYENGESVPTTEEPADTSVETETYPPASEDAISE